ncbi:methyltransferase [Planobispora longispora]|uniref:Methyltransferase n=2 Tax=Planobispora longispora TaxID=28887 RepID=A0A8J3RJZ6_9ACTN|nr:class I SAM-dependent methyltransferase [Planobispora longispora]GIH76060.1 methyltransferase [Planobispora longispora]
MWAVGDAYERYMGRWSRPAAAAFVAWLGVPARRSWLDVGCGTGALGGAVLAAAEPATLVGVDPSAGFVAHARARTGDRRARFVVGDARSLPFPGGRFDAAVSGLMLNFVPEPADAVAELARVVTPGGTVAAYVWDYIGGMTMLRRFWDAATALDPAAGDLEEAVRFSMCRPEPIRRLWTGAGLAGVVVEAIDVPTVFRDFDDFWTPFLGAQGPAPAYAVSLTEDHRSALRELLRERLPAEPDGSIALSARAWAVRGEPGDA